MLVITFRTVTFIVAWRWCSRRTISSAVVPWAASELLEPAQRGRDGRVLVAQALEELDAGGRRQRRTPTAGAARPPRPPGCPLPRPSRLSASSSARCRAARLRTICVGEAAEVLDEQDPQADGDRPELADRQRLAPPGTRGPSAAGSPGRTGCPCARRTPRRGRGPAGSPRGGPRRAWAARGSSRGGRSSRISRSCSSTMWKLSTSHSAAGVIARSSLIARARTRYASSRTRPFSATRGPDGVPATGRVGDRLGGGKASARAARAAPTLKSSARIGSSDPFIRPGHEGDRTGF